MEVFHIFHMILAFNKKRSVHQDVSEVLAVFDDIRFYLECLILQEDIANLYPFVIVFN